MLIVFIIGVFFNVSCKLPSEMEFIPIPSGHTVVSVSTESELENALNSLADHTTILLASGTYYLSETTYGQFVTPYTPEEPIKDVAIRGQSGNPEDVIIYSNNIGNSNLQYGFNVGKVDGLLIAYLTVENVYYHAVTLSAHAQNVRLYGNIFRDTGEQQIKINPDTNERRTHIVEYSVIEYTSPLVDHPDLGICYSNGISAHHTSDLVVQHNLFKGFQCSSNELIGPCVLVWNNSTNTIVNANTFINCERGIALGFEEGDHEGGIIKNNVFIRRTNAVSNPDCAIHVVSPNCVVAHNTIDDEGTYYAPIEVRYATTTGVSVINNILLDGSIVSRNGVTIQTNIGNMEAGGTLKRDENFWDVDNEDYHLLEGSSLIDQITSTSYINITDFDEKTRPYGSAADVGAYEFNPNYEPPPTNNKGFMSNGSLSALLVILVSVMIL